MGNSESTQPTSLNNIDEINIETVHESKPMNMNFISEMVGNMNLVEDESDAIASNIHQSSPKKSLDPKNLDISVFLSSTPIKKGPLHRRMDKLAVNDFISARCSPVKATTESLEEIDSFRVLIYKSSTPAQQGAFMRRFDKITLNDDGNYSPIFREQENPSRKVNEIKSQTKEGCKKSLAF